MHAVVRTLGVRSNMYDVTNGDILFFISHDRSGTAKRLRTHVQLLIICTNPQLIHASVDRCQMDLYLIVYASGLEVCAVLVL